MSNFLIQNQNYVQDGLGTLTFTIPSTNQYTVRCQTTVMPDSSLAILVKKNGSTVYTAPALVPGQIALEFKTSLQCTAADSVTVVFSSSAAVDEQLNSIKSNVSIEQGE